MMKKNRNISPQDWSNQLKHRTDKSSRFPIVNKSLLQSDIKTNLISCNDCWLKHIKLKHKNNFGKDSWLNTILGSKMLNFKSKNFNTRISLQICASCSVKCQKRIKRLKKKRMNLKRRKIAKSLSCENK